MGSIPVVREFCRLAVDFLKKGVTPKVYQSASRKSRVCCRQQLTETL